MGSQKLHLIIVNLKKKIFDDFVKKIQVTGSEGGLGIYPNHAPLLTIMKPGIINIYTGDNKDKQDFIYISGGILEIQENVVSILSNTAIHGKDLDEKMALKSKKEAELLYFKQKRKNYSAQVKASIELSKAIFKLRIIELMRK